jgi:hypothetical protein
LQLGFTEVTYPSGGDLDRVVASCKELVAAAHQENIPVFLTEIEQKHSDVMRLGEVLDWIAKYQL